MKTTSSPITLYYACLLVFVQRVAGQCHDSPTFSFASFDWKGTVATRDCEWLTIVRDPKVTQRRIRNWCPFYSNGFFVREKCPLTCGACNTPNENPSAGPPTVKIAPTTAPVSPSGNTISTTLPTSFDPTKVVTCKDSLIFTFEGDLDCAWLTRHGGDPTRNARRIKNWCPQETKGVIIQDMCPLSCGVCSDETTSTDPNNEPSTAPPSITPSSDVLTEVVTCKDSLTFTFEGDLDCTWLTRHGDPTRNARRIKNWCPLETKGVIIQDMCPLSCGVCSDEAPSTGPNTFSPTALPSFAPSESPPSNTPSTVPSVSPSYIPSSTPSIAPSSNVLTEVVTCKDSLIFTFEGDLDCAWLTRHGDPTRNARRIKNWCPLETKGVIIRDMCPLSCGVCTVSLSSMPNETQSAGPDTFGLSVLPTIAPSDTPSILLSVPPSDSPSNTPSAVLFFDPSTLLSTTPNHTPSTVPSIPPSDNLSNAPSASTGISSEHSFDQRLSCFSHIDNIVGKTYYFLVTVNSRYVYCFSVEPFDGGRLQFSSSIQNCSEDGFTSSGILSFFDSSSGNTATFKEGPLGWTGQMVVLEDQNISQIKAAGIFERKEFNMTVFFSQC